MYFFDDFNTKFKAAVLKQKQDWEVSQIKYGHARPLHLYNP